MSAAPSSGTEALQGALAAEHTVIWAYDLIGATVPAAQQGAVHAAQTAHENRRDALAARLRHSGVDPVAARADYELPFAVTSAAAAWKLAVLLERRCGAVWRYVLETDTDRTVRRQALDALIATARQATTWTRQQGDPATVALPGAP